MNYENLLFDAYNYANDNNIYNYMLDDFIDVTTKAYIELLKFLNERNIPFMFNEGLYRYEYIEFLYYDPICKNDLLDHYGIKYEEKNIDIMIRKDKKKYDRKSIRIVRYPINLLVDFNNKSKDKWLKLLK